MAMSTGIQYQRRIRSALLKCGRWCCAAMSLLLTMGCGTTRMSDTLRTGTEQILISAAIDRSVNAFDFSELRGKDVYFDPQYLKGVSDEGYIVSSIRQKLLSEGVFLKGIREEATYVVEARSGAVGTNRQDVLIGVPQTTLPTGAFTGGVPSVIPEIPFVKKTHQKGVSKLAVFAYNQVTGQAIWQSGTAPVTADARDTWIFGTGPFQRGSIYAGTRFSGQRVSLFGDTQSSRQQPEVNGVSVNLTQSFSEDPDVVPPAPPAALAQKATEAKDKKIAPASFTPAVPPSQPQPGRIPSPAPPTSTTPTTAAGFNSTYSISDSANPASSSGGNAAAGSAAGILIFKNSTTKTTTE